MEADHQVFKHLCKLCNRSFPCGRSLGGHMRSHLMNNQADSSAKLKKMKIQDLKKDGSNTTGIDKFLGVEIHDGYSLRKNPKKTCKLADFSAVSPMEDRICRECGKRFESWKALFSHMKCHSTETERVSSNLEFDSQSDNEIPPANRGKRSRRQARYIVTTAAASSSFSFANASSSSASGQNDQEQEEVALCLMMLSRDVAAGVYSTTESSENNSMPKQVPFLPPKNQFSILDDGSKMMKLNEFHSKKLDPGEMDSGNYLKFEGSNSEFSASDVKISRKSKQYERCGTSSETEFNQFQLVSSKFSTKEREFYEPHDRELRSNSMKKPTRNDMNSETQKTTEKRSKFQCDSCNRIFHSYQALGGHRASHRKTKGCMASKIESSENSIETEISNDPTFESKPLCSEIEENQQELNVGYEKSSRKLHECSICFRIFSSGQALGGHKRSHLIARSETRRKMPQMAVIQKPEAEIREFLDLNLPAPVEEEDDSHVDSVENWWVDQQEQPLVSLI